MLTCTARRHCHLAPGRCWGGGDQGFSPFFEKALIKVGGASGQEKSAQCAEHPLLRRIAEPWLDPQVSKLAPRLSECYPSGGVDTVAVMTRRKPSTQAGRNSNGGTLVFLIYKTVSSEQGTHDAQMGATAVPHHTGTRIRRVVAEPLPTPGNGIIFGSRPIWHT